MQQASHGICVSIRQFSIFAPRELDEKEQMVTSPAKKTSLVIILIIGSVFVLSVHIELFFCHEKNAVF